MNRSTILRRFTLLGIAGLTATVLAACGGNGDSTGGMNHGGSPSPTSSAQPGATFNDADVTFAQMMIPHHQQAVEMATLAETRAADPEIKSLATQIKSAQDPEIKTMTGWLTSWGQPTAAPGGHNMPGMGSSMPGMMSDEEMAKLKAATGADFDRMFARMMIAHHNGAIQMAKDEQAKGANPEAKALAATIEKTQAAEVATLQKILDRL